MIKEEFKQKIRDVLNELADRIAELESKADTIADNAREEYAKQLETLRELKEKLVAKMDEYEYLSEGKWDVVRSSAVEFIGAVSAAWKESYAKVAEAFKKEH
ncbi:MAG: hypothetical protein LBS52_01430 [Dysgonamonadaceae bacterium]|jgi:hypothetical protein|nr:hypothetical protein [Dysgonamonadaceae bacterium]